MKWASMPSVMGHNFSQVPQAEIPRSSFDRSHGIKTAFDSGYLVPIFHDFVVPGDTHKLSLTAFARLSTPVVPILDNLYCDFFFFFVPYRLIWSNFKKFMGEQATPASSTSYTIPQMVCPTNGYDVGTLQDYFGLPTAGTYGVAAGNTYTHSTLPLRAYALCYNEWFRDENLQDSVTCDLGDGPDTYSNYVLLKRGKRKDYFTGCLPWAQKGTAVSLPLGTSAPVIGNGSANPIRLTGASSGAVTNFLFKTDTLARHGYSNVSGTATDNEYAKWTTDSAYSGLIADLSSATAATINSIRLAVQLQRFYERDARGGTRYTEIVKSHFGVTSPDARLQRPELLGSASVPIRISPIAQTSATGATGTPQGNLSAMGTLNASGVGFTKSFTEHGVILGLASVRADLNYQQGLNRQWSYSTRADMYWPSFAHLGEQAVLNKEIYCRGDSNDALTFGYQERYAEMRYKNSVITGKLRSTYSTPLDVWHLAQKFTSLPTLADTFIKESPPVDRVVAVTTEPQILFDGFFNYISVRPMPTFSVPGQMDRF